MPSKGDMRKGSSEGNRVKTWQVYFSVRERTQELDISEHYPGSAYANQGTYIAFCIDRRLQKGGILGRTFTTSRI
ncbi:hypothetical protein TNCV_3745861 [Trichonephila clavipes]|nr:hypothetical protein TNCV_3745861 [Trichonephila clavipes]